MKRFLLLVVLLLVGCSTVTTPRPSSWAEPIKAKHLTNFYKVSDNLYRSSQPDKEGLEEAKTLGIKTVIDLQAWPHKDFVVPGLRYERIPQLAEWTKMIMRLSSFSW
jgi:hypothetical protein